MALVKIHVQKSIDIHARGTEVGEPPWIKLRAFSKRQDTLRSGSALQLARYKYDCDKITRAPVI